MFDGFKKRILFIYFGVSTLPLFVMLATVIGAVFFVMSGNAAADIILISLLVIAFIMFAASLVFSLFVSDYINGITKTLDTKLTRVLSEEQINALNTGSGENPYVLFLNSIDFYNNKIELFKDEYRDFKLIMDASRFATNIIWWKIKDDGNFHLNIPDYWSNNYPAIPFGSVCDLYNYIISSDVETFKNAVTAAENSPGMRIKQQLRLRISPENHIRVTINASSGIDDNGTTIITGAIIDINKMYELDKQNRELESKFMFTVKAVEDIMLEMDFENDTSFIYTPKAWENMLDLEKVTDGFTKERNNYWDRIHPDFKEGYLDRFLNFDHIATLPQKELSYEYRVKNKKGDFNWVEQVVKVVSEEDGVVKKALMYIFDINERKRRELKRMVQSNHDSLTGALLKYAMKEDFDEYAANLNSEIALILIRIDGLRHINDQYGYETGDKTLRSVVNSCWQNTIKNCLVGKTDGDEFVITIKDPYDAISSPVLMAGRILNNYQTPIIIDKHKVNVTLSIGIAFKDKEIRSFEDVYMAAKKAADEAKSKGKNQYMVYTDIGKPEMVKFQKKEDTD